MASDYGLRPPSYRLPDATRVGGVRLQVSDLDRSIEYYRDVIGLQVHRREDGDAALGPHGEEVALLELHERSGAQPVPPHGRYGLYHFAILLPDRTVLGRFLTHLANIDARVASADHLVSEALYLWDPDGLGIEVYADRPRIDWRTNGRELAMTTEPVDLRGLMRAAQGAPWRGMPAGTVIGHVHLHVGDLARAEALYHAALGFDKVVWSFPGALFLSAGGYHHHLGTNTWVEGASPATDGDARLLQWELQLPTREDVDTAAANVAAAGYAVEQQADGVSVTDDWGTTVRLTPQN